MEGHLHGRRNKPAQEETTAPAGAQNPSYLFSDVDSISYLPDEILHHILSVLPTKLAMATSILSKQWRHVWCGTPCLSFSRLKVPIESIRKTLASYSAVKIILSLPGYPNLCTRHKESPHFFFNNPSLKQLTLDSKLVKMIPRCTVSWTSLQNLSMSHCIFSDESFPKILSGCPVLESLTLQYSGFLSFLDLSESLRLDLSRDLDGPLKDVYHVMLEGMLEKFQNVENLTVGFSFLQRSPETRLQRSPPGGACCCSMLSIADFCGVCFRTFKVKTLTLKTTILRSAVPGVAKLLQNSLGLKKIIFYKTDRRLEHCSGSFTMNLFYYSFLTEKRVNSYLGPQDMIFPASSFKVAKPDVVASFMELLLGNTRTLETLVWLSNWAVALLDQVLMSCHKSHLHFLTNI
ncbi:hypothetical protein F2Q68_00031408, partial [Brassica cretica]